MYFIPFYCQVIFHCIDVPHFIYPSIIVKAMVFPVVMYGCENWTIKKDEHQRIDAFKLWCGRRLLRVPWATRRSNQSIVKEISPKYSLEGLMLKLQYSGCLTRRTDSLEKTVMLRKIEGGRRRGRQEEVVGWHLRLSGRESELVKDGEPGLLRSPGSKRVGHS